MNFGANKSLNTNIGAGDILPDDISTVKINGIEGIRKNIPRPGYYAGNKYLPIYDGDKIEIMSRNAMKDEDIRLSQEAREKRWKKLRMNDMQDTNAGISLTNLLEDFALEQEYTLRETERKEKRIKYSKYNPEGRERFMEMFGDTIKKETEHYGIPTTILIDNLFANENRNFNPNAKNPYSSAH